MRDFWLQFGLLQLNLDRDEYCIDICSLVCGGTNGPAFSGSLFMFYREMEPFHDPRECHIVWDFLYLHQLFDKYWSKF